MLGFESRRVVAGHDIGQARAIAEAIRNTVGKNVFQCGSKVIRMTCSIGVCAYPTPQIRTAALLMKCLDDSLYQAKRAGRNIVRIAGFPEESGPSRSINVSNL